MSSGPGHTIQSLVVVAVIRKTTALKSHLTLWSLVPALTHLSHCCASSSKGETVPHSLLTLMSLAHRRELGNSRE